MKSIALCLLAAAAACGPADRSRPGGNGNGPDGGNGNGGSNGSGNQDGCSDSAKLVYTVAKDNTFSQFDPAAKAFTDLGKLACNSGAMPFSMGVDRNTIAWVLYDDGSLYRVDINNHLACTKTAWASPMGLTEFGMGFSTDTAGGDTDTLYVAGGTSVTGASSASLATLDTSSFSASPKGTVNGWPELTGTGAAELWGWFPSDELGLSTPHVDKLDKSHGTSLMSFPLSSLQGAPTAWAFAFWGGDFWIFLEKDAETSTTVYQLDGTAGTIKGMTGAGGREIVGAGVSTCAPIVIQ